MDAALTTRGGDVCPVCGGAARPRIDLADFRLFACAGCGSWSSDALVRAARTSFEPAAYFANADADRRRWTELLGRTGVDATRPTRVLDVGCGEGDFLRFVGRVAPSSQRSGVELDPERAARAREADPDARVALGAVPDALAELRGEFDLITLWDVFEHLADPAAALCALAARLAPDGRLFIQTIHEQSVVPSFGRAVYAASSGRWRGPARRTHEPHHLVFYSRRGLRVLAGRAGLRVRAQWFDRLARERMDGSRALTALTSLVLGVEVALGGGLFINVLLERERPQRGQSAS